MFAVVKFNPRTGQPRLFSKHRTAQNARKAATILRCRSGITGVLVRWCWPNGTLRFN